MNVTYVGGTQRQRSWFQEAMSRALYPWDHCTADVAVHWGEPPCPGHNDFACTVNNGGGSFTLTIRDTLDTQNVMNAPVKDFYEETCIHELGHVVMESFGLEDATVAGYFYHDEVGQARRYGTAADLNPSDQPWDMHVVEAEAETFKDIFLAEQFRAYDNRTQWQLDQAHYTDFTGLILPPADPGSPGTSGAHMNVPLTFLGSDGIGQHIPADIAASLGETLDRPYPDSEQWQTIYHFQFANYTLPEGATNITAQLQFRGVAEHFPTRVEGSSTDPAVYTFDNVLDGDFADTEIATGIYGIGSVDLHGSGMSLGPSYLSSGNEALPFIYAHAVDAPPSGGLTDWTFWTAKVGVDSPWPWTQYLLTISGPAAPVVVITYDIPAVPPTPAADAPPWPYQDPQLGGGGGPTGVVRIGKP